MADTKDSAKAADAPKTRQQRLTAQYLFRRKIYGPPEGKAAAMVEVPADFPTEEELKAREQATQLSTLGGPSQPLSISARSAKAAKAALLEEGEDIENDEELGAEDEEDEEDEDEPVAVDARGEPLYTEDSTEDGSLDESMAATTGEDEGGTPRKRSGRAKRAAKKSGKKK